MVAVSQAPAPDSNPKSPLPDNATVGQYPTVALTGNGELGFDSGEGARETATTSKEGSRRANYPILTQGGSDKKYQYEASCLVIGMRTI